MIPGNVPRIIKLDYSKDYTFKHGDTVTISVIKRLTGHKWAVGIKGTVLPAFSEKQLIPGQKLKAYVIRQGDKILLKLDAPLENRFSEYLSLHGLQDDGLTKVIISSLFASHVSIDPGIIAKMRHIISKMKKKPIFIARLLSILYAKNIDISSEKIESFLGLLNYGEDESGQRGKEEKKRFLKNAKEIIENCKKNIKKSTKNNPLQVFNHMKGENPSWLIVPYSMQTDTIQIKGTIRFLYNSIHQKIEKMTIVVHQDDTRYYFHLTEKKNNKILMIFCNNEEKRAQIRKEIDKLFINLQNTGLKIDDTIYKEEDFDGFTPLEDFHQYRKINIVVP